jgi:RNA polymerase sigma factor (sigma-70 family)
MSGIVAAWRLLAEMGRYQSMANGQLDLVIRHIRKMVGDGSCEGTDQELLERFASHHEEPVFEALMERHGPMVLGVCQRVLDHEQDAEDVFQATFLVLARQARSIRKHGSLGSWLYGVAYRLSLKLRASAARRRARERQVGEMRTIQTSADSTWSDLRPIFDEELHRLPEKYRVPLVLCYLEGKTNVEAGRMLGWPAGSMSKRLARGRELLRTRLENRGVALSTTVLASVLVENARAVVPASLCHSSLKAALLIGAGHALTSVVSSQVGSLVHGVVHTMFMTKLCKVGLGMVLSVGILSITVKFALQPTAGAKTENQNQETSAGTSSRGDAKSDLALVPGNALGFLRISFHDIWSMESMKEMREQVAKSEPFQEMEKNLGFGLADIDSLTLIMLPPGEGGRGEPELLIAVTTLQAVTKDKILNALVPEAQEQHHKGKSYFASKGSPAGPGGGPGPRPHLFFAAEPAVYFAGDRLFLVGEHRELLRNFDRLGWAAAQNPLGAGMKLAEKKHTLVAAFQISDQIHEMITSRPPPGESAFLRPLLDVQSGTLVVDLKEKGLLNARVELSFANEETAKESKNALATGLDMVKRFLTTGASPELKKDEIYTALARELTVALESTQITQEKQFVRGTAETKAPLVGMLLPAVQKVRVAAKRTQSANNLKQIALAMHNYHDTYGRFPPQAISTKDGKPLLSWRVAILPFIEQDNLYKQFKLDEPWDSEHNKKLIDKMPQIYAPVSATTKNPFETFYQAFAGKGTVFEPGEKITFASIPDGTSNTLMIVEAGDSVPWTKPEDLPFDPSKPLPKLGAEFPDVFLAALCDGSVREISKNIDPNLLKLLIIRNSGEVKNLR